MTTNQKSRKQILFRPPRYRPPGGRWIWAQHLPAAAVLGFALLALWFTPAEWAELGQWTLISDRSALYLRGGITLFMVLAVLGVRGQPWWHTLIGSLFGLGMSLMIARSMLSDVPMPLGQLFVVVGVGALAVLYLARPSIYERLDESQAKNAAKDEKITHLESELKRVGRQAEHFERLYYEVRDLQACGQPDRRKPRGQNDHP